MSTNHDLPWLNAQQAFDFINENYASWSRKTFFARAKLVFRTKEYPTGQRVYEKQSIVDYFASDAPDIVEAAMHPKEGVNGEI